MKHRIMSESFCLVAFHHINMPQSGQEVSHSARRIPQKCMQRSNIVEGKSSISEPHTIWSARWSTHNLRGYIHINTLRVPLPRGIEALRFRVGGKYFHSPLWDYSRGSLELRPVSVSNHAGGKIGNHCYILSSTYLKIPIPVARRR
jgi:hypothetical protein